ncbi:MAG: co-chaperone GroES [Candidatus Doudnabacteria bacterium]|nr:co-chaperone GroES [Candidatus Doudnabacteria bacterium]
MKVKPIGDRILVKTVSREETTKSGIVLPDTAEKQKSGFYEIVALGDGEAAKKFTIGQNVVAGKYSGEEVEMKDDKETEYKVLFVGKEKNESDVVALIE